MSRGEYSPLVRELFGQAGHAGDLPEGEGTAFQASRDEGGSGCSIVVSGRTDGDRWLVLRYRVFGCPHLVAAAEWAARQFEGAGVESPAPFPVNTLIETLDVPVEKTGRILLLEDAYRALENRRLESLDNRPERPQ